MPNDPFALVYADMIHTMGHRLCLHPQRFSAFQFGCLSNTELDVAGFL